MFLPLLEEDEDQEKTNKKIACKKKDKSKINATAGNNPHQNTTAT